MNRFRDLVVRGMGHHAGRGLLVITIIVACGVAAAEDGTGSHAKPAGAAVIRQLATLANLDILESSGMAASRDVPNRFWTHNDSGDGPRLFAFDSSGRDLDTVSLTGITAVDWEDMSSFRRDERGWLLVADVGDNARRRRTCQLHLLPEPAVGARLAAVHTTIHFRYASGPRDCEAVGIDESSNTVLLIAKATFQSEIFALRLPAISTDQVLVASPIATIQIPLATALDVAPHGHRAVVLTYGNAYEFPRRDGESWSDAFRREPHTIPAPVRRQGESICYAADGWSLFLTSEKQPTPLWKIERAPREEGSQLHDPDESTDEGSSARSRTRHDAP